MRQAFGWIAGFVLFISYFLLTEFLPEHSLIIWVLLATVTVAVLLVGAPGTIYECPACGRQFEPDFRTDMTSPHYPGARLLRCPKCGKVDWARLWSRGATLTRQGLRVRAKPSAEAERDPRWAGATGRGLVIFPLQSRKMRHPVRNSVPAM